MNEKSPSQASPERKCGKQGQARSISWTRGTDWWAGACGSLHEIVQPLGKGAYVSLPDPHDPTKLEELTSGSSCCLVLPWMWCDCYWACIWRGLCSIRWRRETLEGPYCCLLCIPLPCRRQSRRTPRGLASGQEGFRKCKDRTITSSDLTSPSIFQHWLTGHIIPFTCSLRADLELHSIRRGECLSRMKPWTSNTTHSRPCWHPHNTSVG